MKKALILSIGVIALSLSSFAQRDLTLYNARYLQQSSFTNASFMPECKVNVGGIVFGSTYLYYGNNGLPRKSFVDFVSGTDGVVTALDRMKPLNYMNLDFRKDIIHFGFRVKRNYFSPNISLRSQTTVSYPRDIATLIFLGNGIDPSDPGASDIPAEYMLLGNRASFDGLAVDHSTWTEIGFQYARTFLPDEQLTIGIRPKLLMGLVNIYTKETTLGLTTDAQSFAWTLDGSYQYSTSLPFDTSGEFNFKPFDNLGWGVDLGATYNINDKLQVSASANDIGRIKWKNNPQTYSASNGVVDYRGAVLDGSILSVGTRFDSLGADFASQMVDSLNSQFGPDTSDADYSTWLTTRYNIGANYQFADRHNVGVLLNAHTIKRKLRAAFNVSYNFRVRKWFGFHANYSIYNRSYTNLGLGLSFNIWPWQFYAMTDNALFFLPGSRNTMIRGGINWTFGCKNDKDKDGIADNKDDCPKVPGLAQFNGCPDTDGDGIMDQNDSCVTIKGPAATNGCPDADGDGIIDSEDDCPDTPGIVEFKGCPDSDNDGIMDKLDSCAQDSGLVEFNGCPDTDADGIMDKEDACPDKFGPIENEGCPDTDGDGLPDHKDNCPEVAGPKDNNGCPYGDKDGDGVPDKDDACVDVKGPVENKGCPYADLDGDGVLDKDDACIDVPGPPENNGCPFSDIDGDGVLDKDDRCPQTPGVASNQGCPEIKAEEKEVLDQAFANLEFETGKEKIKASSYESLDKLAALLVEKEDWKLQISGHTDNVGNDAANMTLSEKRSKAVASYIESKGVPKSRMIVQWYGETKPIADNATAEGRALNRRVEMEVIFD
ncbi:MAG: DUF5723 family protein [Flavobacteriales bacterium]